MRALPLKTTGFGLLRYSSGISATLIWQPACMLGWLLSSIFVLSMARLSRSP
jgi:hypothetical protein